MLLVKWTLLWLVLVTIRKARKGDPGAKYLTCWPIIEPGWFFFLRIRKETDIGPVTHRFGSTHSCCRSSRYDCAGIQFQVLACGKTTTSRHFSCSSPRQPIFFKRSFYAINLFQADTMQHLSRTKGNSGGHDSEWSSQVWDTFGKDGCAKSDEFSEKFQTAFDPPLISENYVAIFFLFIMDMVEYMRHWQLANSK